jgi:hypothetical protein
VINTYRRPRKEREGEGRGGGEREREREREDEGRRQREGEKWRADTLRKVLKGREHNNCKGKRQMHSCTGETF